MSKHSIIAELAARTGVSEEDIEAIIELVGFNRSSIIREANLMKLDRERERAPRRLPERKS